MACGPQRSATCNGSRSNCPRAASTFTASRTGFLACIRSAVTRCGRCASYAVITRQTPTRGGPIGPIGFHRLIQRLGEAAKMPFPIHPHMLRHACGFKLANDGHDTRALQHYLGHKNIQHTVRYTDMAPDRFKDFWRS
jgi:site-specific recombinase XerD